MPYVFKRCCFLNSPPLPAAAKWNEIAGKLLAGFVHTNFRENKLCTCTLWLIPLVLCSSFRKKTFPVFNNKRVLFNPYLPVKSNSGFWKKITNSSCEINNKIGIQKWVFRLNSDNPKEFVSFVKWICFKNLGTDYQKIRQIA